MQVLPLTLLLVGACLAEAQLANLTIAVFISGITSSSTGLGVFIGDLDGRQFQAAVDVAVEAVNNHTGLLDGYNLQVQYVDSQCSPGPSVRGFIEQIFDLSERILIIGSDCSTATEPVAELAPFYGLIQISPLSSSPSLSNFGEFLRLVPSDVAATEGIVTLMKMYNWTRLGVISQQESGFTSTVNALSATLEENNYTSNTFTFNTGDDPEPFVMSLSNSPSRIIFLNVYPSYAIEILCLAQNFGMTLSEGYLWLLYPWYPRQWWTLSPARESPITCPRTTIEGALEGSIVIDYLPLPSDEGRDRITAAGLTRAEYESRLNQRLEEAYPGADTSLFHQTHLYFDAVLMGALALNATKDVYDLSLFNYNTTNEISRNITSLINQSSLNSNFLGVSGNIALEGSRERQPVIKFLQYRRSGPNAELSTEFIGNDTYFDNVQVIFPMGVPRDEELVFISHPLLIVYTILSCLGILFAIVVAVFLLVFRQRAVIKHSSPYLNLLIIAGTVLFYVDVILFGIDEGTPASTCTVNALCMTRVWIASIAFSLMFGTIFIKTWRVYYAFLSGNRRKPRKSKIAPDWLLFTVVGVLVAVDVVFLIIVTAVPDARLRLTTEEIPSNSRELPHIIRLCTAPQSLIWVIVMLIYKGILLLVGLFLAFETRSVKIKQLNDSKKIGMAVYVVAILSVASAIIGVLLTMMVDVFYGVVGILTILCSTVVLCLIFIPSFYGLWKDPEGFRVNTSRDPQSSGAFDTITGLSNEVEKLKSELHRLSGLIPQEVDHQLSDSSKVEDTNGATAAVLVDKKAVKFTASVQN